MAAKKAVTILNLAIQTQCKDHNFKLILCDCCQDFGDSEWNEFI